MKYLIGFGITIVLIPFAWPVLAGAGTFILWLVLLWVAYKIFFKVLKAVYSHVFGIQFGKSEKSEEVVKPKATPNPYE